MNVRAKFRVDYKKQTSYGQEVGLVAVSSGSEDNQRFFKATPSGSIEIRTINDAAAEQFRVGQEFYVDFTPAEPAGSAR